MCAISKEVPQRGKWEVVVRKFHTKRWILCNIVAGCEVAPKKKTGTGSGNALKIFLGFPTQPKGEPRKIAN